MIDIEVDDAERCPDESDRASIIEHAANMEAIDRALRRVEKPPADFDGANCVDCGDLIPEARLRTGAFRDIDCQTKHELKSRNHRSHYAP